MTETLMNPLNMNEIERRLMKAECARASEVTISTEALRELMDEINGPRAESTEFKKLENRCANLEDDNADLRDKLANIRNAVEARL
jgi:hypothetical protein